jgi:hypothetical protein
MPLRPALISAIAIAALAMPPTAAVAQQKAPPQKASVTGTWSGTVTQVGRAKGYDMVLIVRENGGETNYPSLNCSGQLTRVGASDGYTFFIEKITRGRIEHGGQCIDGSITISTACDKMVWGWVGADQGKAIVAFSTLNRK